MKTADPTPTQTNDATARAAMFTVVALAAVLLWSYWPTLHELIAFWQINQDYSAGMLVPFVAIYLVWIRRKELAAHLWRPTAWGAAALLLSQLVRFVGIYYGYAFFERLSFVFTVASVVLLIGGWTIFRRLIWIQLFLLLMVPFPSKLHYEISAPLQSWATGMGRFGLELFGFYVQREGNVLYVEENTVVSVAEACNGLRMLTAFLVTAAALCLIIRRPAWQKAALMATSIPVAIVCNGVRVWVTAVFMYYADDPSIEGQFHDIAGLLMMPLALLILLVELKLLDALVSGAPADAGRKGQTPPGGAAKSKTSLQS